MEAVKHDLVLFLSSFVCQLHSLEANRIFKPILPEIGRVRMLVNGILWCWIHLASCERKNTVVNLSLAKANRSWAKPYNMVKFVLISYIEVRSKIYFIILDGIEQQEK